MAADARAAPADAGARTGDGRQHLLSTGHCKALCVHLLINYQINLMTEGKEMHK